MRFVPLAIVVLALPTSVDAISCTDATARCRLNTTCSASFANYTSECGNAIATGRASACTSACRAALARLNSTDAGRLLTTCVCLANDSGCLAASTHFDAACFGISSNGTTTSNLTCVGVRQCAADATCQQSFLAYSANCQLAFLTGECSDACRAAFEQLNATNIGRGALNCSWSNLAMASFHRSCFSNATDVVDSCVDDVNTACTADPTCKPLNVEYLKQCADAFQGQKCSSACNASYFALIGDSVGRRYATCACVGPFAETCSRYRDGILKTCFGITPPTPPKSTPSTPTSGQETHFRLPVTVIAVVSVVSACLY